jgi:hypothetical protein
MLDSRFHGLSGDEAKRQLFHARDHLIRKIFTHRARLVAPFLSIVRQKTGVCVGWSALSRAAYSHATVAALVDARGNVSQATRRIGIRQRFLIFSVVALLWESKAVFSGNAQLRICFTGEVG